MIAALSTRGNRIRTFILLGVCGLSAIGAAALGIDDNPPGVLLAYLAATAFVLAFAHPWRTPAPFLRLLFASILGFVVFVLLDSLLEPGANNLGRLTPFLDFLHVAGTALFMLGTLVFPAGVLVGGVGAVIMAIRNRRQPPPGPLPPA